MNLLKQKLFAAAGWMKQSDPMAENTKTLLELLEAYGRGDTYPFHMPGHKRRLGPEQLQNVIAMDITEIDGFDNLHDPQGILRDAQERAAHLYHSEETYFMVNGSSGGLLAAIAACCRNGGEIAVARNCHQSVYHALEIQQLQPVYIYPQFNTCTEICEGTYPQDVEKLWITNPNIQAIVITSPTYEGVVSDIRKICQIAHTHKTPVIVDEAHGAHLTFHPYFPESAVDCGADLVIQSTHKTLPMLTQTALIHVNGSLVDRDRIRRMLRVYQTSSPSYLLMGSIDAGLRLIADQKEALLSEYTDRLEDLRSCLKQLKHLTLFDEEMLTPGAFAAYDRSKLLILTQKSSLTGPALHQLLLQHFHLQMEMVSAGAVLAMTSIGDDDEGYDRLKNALYRIDREAGPAPAERNLLPGFSSAKCLLPIYDAALAKRKAVKLAEAAGSVSASYIYLYPPDIPIVTPGEQLTDEIINILTYYIKAGLSVKGVETRDKQDPVVYIVDNHRSV